MKINDKWLTSPSQLGVLRMKYCTYTKTMSLEQWMNIAQLKNNGRMSVEASQNILALIYEN